ncbi:hypothetical protein OAQ37_05265 [Alphaproteobacteria bacterium]|nr:hypothetical protein [Alphaproteobacteria bacterium]
MKNTIAHVIILSLGLGFISSVTKAEETKSSTNDKNIYVFANYGLAILDASVNSAVSTGSLTLTTTLDDEGSITTFGVGWEESKNLSFEVYAGIADGFSATTTVTATNAVIDGVTYNGSLAMREELSGTLLGANAVFTNEARFDGGSALTFAGRVGLAQHRVEDELSLSGSGTVNGVSYSAASPAVATIKETGTSVTLGAGVNYSTSDDVEFSFGVNHIPGLGGGDLVEADLTFYNLGIAVRF